jgi:hypothetical protein
VPERPAYIDESFQEHDSEGFYVLAAAVLGHGSAEIGTLLKGLAAHRSPGKLHWAGSSSRYRRAATERIAGLDAFHVVAVGAPVAPRKQERARAICLRRLAFELNGLGFDLPKGTSLHVEHRRGAREPRLWVADVVAGIVRAHRQGDSAYLELLGDRLHLVEVPTSG